MLDDDNDAHRAAQDVHRRARRAARVSTIRLFFPIFLPMDFKRHVVPDPSPGEADLTHLDGIDGGRDGGFSLIKIGFSKPS